MCEVVFTTFYGWGGGGAGDCVMGRPLALGKAFQREPLRRSLMCHGGADTVGVANVMMINTWGFTKGQSSLIYRY